MNHTSRRLPYVAATLAAAAVIALAAAPSGLGQESGRRPDLAALEQQLARLQERVAALEEGAADVRAPFVVRDEQNREIFRVAVKDGQPELVLGEERAPLLAVAIAGETRNPRLTIGKESGARFEAGIADGGNGAYVTLIDQAGVERTSIKADGQATAIGLTNAQGFEILKAGVENEETKLTLGTEPGARLEAEVADGGEGVSVTLTDKANTERVVISSAGDDAPLTVSDEQAAAFFTVKQEQEQARMILGHEDGARLRAGVTEGGGGSFVSLIDKANTEGAFVVAEADSTVIALAGDKSEEFFSVRLEAQQPRLTVGKADAARLQAGVTKDGDGSFLSLIDGGNEERAWIMGEPDRAHLGLSDKFVQVDLGTTDDAGKRLGLFLGKDDRTLASLRASAEDGGWVTVMNAKGEAVAGLLADTEGGELHVAGPNGGVTQAMIGGTSQGGLMYLYEDSGKPRINLEATKVGTFSVQGDAGIIMLTSGNTAPRLELADRAGTPMVQLGITTGGEGIVRTGPGGNGPAGVLGAGLKPASSIQGKK